MTPFRSVNPTTEQLVREYPAHDAGEVESLLAQARAAFDPWRALGVAGRAPFISWLAQVLRGRRAELAGLMTEEMGKPIGAAEAEVDKCAACCDYFARSAGEFLADEVIGSDAARSYVRYDPLGAVLAIMPWNFPLWQVFRFAAPALLAGNVGLLKHAPNVPGCALAIESVFRDAGYPPGVFAALMIDTPAVEAVIRHPVVRAVTLTGSERAGMAVAEQAGKALKKTVLELGGSDPFIVLKDANVEAVAKAAAEARCINSGQSCIAAKRFIVERPIAEAFEKAFAEAMAGMTIGDPADRATQIGPLARQDLLDNLAGQVQRSIAAGARLVVGGHRLPRTGYFYPPTLLAEVRPACPRSTRRRSGRWPRWSSPRMPKTRSGWRTSRNTGWARACGRATRALPSSSPGRSTPAVSSSTGQSSPIPASLSAGSKTAGMGGSFRKWEYASSSTSRRCGSSDASRGEEAATVRRLPTVA